MELVCQVIERMLHTHTGEVNERMMMLPAHSIAWACVCVRVMM